MVEGKQMKAYAAIKAIVDTWIIPTENILVPEIDNTTTGILLWSACFMKEPELLYKLCKAAFTYEAPVDSMIEDIRILVDQL